MEERIPRALTIAGSDSGGGAGIQADLKTFAALGVHGMSAITAVTAQNSRAVAGIFDVPPEFIARQIDVVIEDFGADAVKTGMVSRSATIQCVADRLQAYRLEKYVLDPVMVAASGSRLLPPEAGRDLRSLLFPLALIVTPNLHEAGLLAEMEISDRRTMMEAARRIHRLGCRYVLVKGGHLAEESAVDILFDGAQFDIWSAPRVPTENVHGTGCTLSAAITAGLACGRDIRAAIGQAKDYVTQALKRSYRLGAGPGPLGHFERNDE